MKFLFNNLLFCCLFLNGYTHPCLDGEEDLEEDLDDLNNKLEEVLEVYNVDT